MIGWKRITVGAVDDMLKIGKGVAGTGTGHEFLQEIMADEVVQPHKGRSCDEEGKPALFKKPENQDKHDHAWDNKILFDGDE